jgi:hypothetical protein
VELDARARAWASVEIRIDLGPMLESAATWAYNNYMGISKESNIAILNTGLSLALGSRYNSNSKSWLLLGRSTSPFLVLFRSVRNLRVLGTNWPQTVIGPACFDVAAPGGLPEFAVRVAYNSQTTSLALYGRGSGARPSGRVRIPAGAVPVKALLTAYRVPAGASAPPRGPDGNSEYRGAGSALVLLPHGTAFARSVYIQLDAGELALGASAACGGGRVAGKDALVALWRPDDSPGTPWQERPLACGGAAAGGLVTVTSTTFSTYVLALRVSPCGPGRFRTAEATAISLSGSCAPGLDGDYALLPQRVGGGPSYGRTAGGGASCRQVGAYWCCGPQAEAAVCAARSQIALYIGPHIALYIGPHIALCIGLILHCLLDLILHCVLDSDLILPEAGVCAARSPAVLGGAGPDLSWGGWTSFCSGTWVSGVQVLTLSPSPSLSPSLSLSLTGYVGGGGRGLGVRRPGIYTPTPPAPPTPPPSTHPPCAPL